MALVFPSHRPSSSLTAAPLLIMAGRADESNGLDDTVSGLPSTIIPSSYDYGYLSRGTPIIDSEALGRQRRYLLLPLVKIRRIV